MPPNYIQIMDVTPYKKTRQICKAQVTQWSESSPAANTILLQWDFWEIQISKGKGDLVTNRSLFFSELSPICQNSFQNRGRKSGHSTLIIYPFCIQKEWQYSAFLIEFPFLDSELHLTSQLQHYIGSSYTTSTTSMLFFETPAFQEIIALSMISIFFLDIGSCQ